MGKHWNQKAWDQFRPLETAPEVWEEPEPKPVLTEAEKAAAWDDIHYDRGPRAEAEFFWSKP